MVRKWKVGVKGRGMGGKKGRLSNSFVDFLATDKKSQLPPHMPEQKRRFVHNLTAVYRMDTQMLDQKRHQSVQPI
ncbi:hypothetical protein BD311DRAFT_811466 [Dichomitus squalens]|uniref:R3H domain-containing protein n=1 Tax=Dichomitus squalens TaxID=114155 RepID=A0A4Q9M6F0_9APHY|nr:hypothetical protein BD311DRAFT_811466 [Dichomitus squalens]